MTAGRARRHTRGGALDRALVAAGEPPVLSTIPMTDVSACAHFFMYRASQTGFREMAFSEWPTEETSLAVVSREPEFRDGREAVYRLDDGTLALVSVRHGFAAVRIAGPTTSACETAMAAFQQAFPATFVTVAKGEQRIPITFWMMGAFGPTSRLRMIDTASWADVEANYPSVVRDALAPLMDGSFKPGDTGQLILWQGPPGAGKTWALRALASEWRSWAEFSYITDPDTFFVEQAAYMVDVLLADSYSAIDDVTGEVYSGESGPDAKWRVLILEDTGELLSATAKEKYGQGLSRLLNVVDGMIGQGLRVLCLVTTNDELGELNAAVRRPGRCAAQIVFPAFPEDEARAWLAERTAGDLADADVDPDGPMSLAEMYAKIGQAREEPIAPRPEEFTPEPEDARDLMASAAARERLLARGVLTTDDPVEGMVASLVAGVGSDDVVAEIVRVAEAHQDDAVGYGETAWDPESRTVYWIHGDWTDHEAARDDFLAIDGVDKVECEAEALPDGWWSGRVVYPDPAPKWATVPPEKQQAALDALVTLASEPLEL